MRLPIIGDDYSQVDEEKTIEMIRYAIDHGVNYVDTAYPYHMGNSERVVGRALSEGYRERVFLATKSPVWQVERYEDFERYLDEQLERLRTDYIDMYLMHTLNEVNWTKIKELRFWDFFEKAKSEGKIKFAGFSFHDKYPIFREIVDGYDGWDFCQIQLNYMDVNYQAGVKGLKYASSKGLAVVIMEPLKGGKLARLPSRALEILRKSGRDWSPVEWAFRWLANFPEVSTILSGMSSLDQVKENIEIVSCAMPGSLTEQDLKVLDEVRRTIESLAVINCTECGYCMPCPNGVNIPGNFRLYNETIVFEDLWWGRWVYGWFEAGKTSASFCIECGECLRRCPQKLDIPALLKKVHERLKSHA